MKTNIDLRQMFPDYKEVPKAECSKYVYDIPYGNDGNYLEIELFHSEDEGDSEWHLNIFQADKNNDVEDIFTVDVTKFD